MSETIDLYHKELATTFELYREAVDKVRFGVAEQYLKVIDRLMEALAELEEAPEPVGDNQEKGS